MNFLLNLPLNYTFNILNAVHSVLNACVVTVVSVIFFALILIRCYSFNLLFLVTPVSYFSAVDFIHAAYINNSAAYFTNYPF